MTSLGEESDEELMRAYQKGEEEAFTILYRRHSPKIYGFIRKKLSDERAAEDVFQATFLKLHTSRQQYNQEFLFLPWLFTICRTTIVDSFRKQARTKEIANIEVIEASGEIEKDEKYESEYSLPNLEILPTNQRQALELRYTNDLSFNQIAERLQTTPANIRQLVSRAIRKLRRP